MPLPPRNLKQGRKRILVGDRGRYHWEVVASDDMWREGHAHGSRHEHPSEEQIEGARDAIAFWQRDACNLAYWKGYLVGLFEARRFA